MNEQIILSLFNPREPIDTSTLPVDTKLPRYSVYLYIYVDWEDDLPEGYYLDGDCKLSTDSKSAALDRAIVGTNAPSMVYDNWSGMVMYDELRNIMGYEEIE